MVYQCPLTGPLDTWQEVLEEVWCPLQEAALASLLAWLEVVYQPRCGEWAAGPAAGTS